MTCNWRARGDSLGLPARSVCSGCLRGLIEWRAVVLRRRSSLLCLLGGGMFLACGGEGSGGEDAQKGGGTFGVSVAASSGAAGEPSGGAGAGGAPSTGSPSSASTTTSSSSSAGAGGDPASGGGPQGSGGDGEAASLAGRHMLFATGYSTTKAAQKNAFVLLGHYDFAAGGTAKVRYFLYDGNANKLEGVTASQHPPMNAPYGGSCTPGPVRIPSYSSYKDLDAKWTAKGDVLEVRVGDAIHQWARTEPSKGFWQLARDYFDATTGQPVVGGTTFSQTVGFAYEADEARTTAPLGKAAFGASYKVQLHQNNALAGSPWAYSTSSLVLDVFAPSKNDPNLLSYSYSCSGGMWCQRTILLNYAPYSSQLLYMNGGHDFDKNGCYDELGHRYQYFAVVEGGSVSKFVFVEYSYEYDGFPILSVGRAYLQ